jgi:hypothetical protein
MWKSEQILVVCISHSQSASMSYNGSSCLYSASCAATRYFPAGGVDLTNICYKVYKINFQYKVLSPEDSASPEVKGETDNSTFSLRTVEIQSTSFNIWQKDSITTTTPVTADHQVFLEFFFWEKSFGSMIFVLRI